MQIQKSFLLSTFPYPICLHLSWKSLLLMFYHVIHPITILYLYQKSVKTLLPQRVLTLFLLSVHYQIFISCQFFLGFFEVYHMPFPVRASDCSRCIDMTFFTKSYNICQRYNGILSLTL